MRYELFRGRLTADQFAASEADLHTYLKERAGAKPHLAMFLAPTACTGENTAAVGEYDRVMYRYKTREGDDFEGATAEEAAQTLRAISRNQEKTLRLWISGVAVAAQMQTGERVRDDTAENFLADLVAARLIFPREI
jgi:hypothetical protein